MKKILLDTPINPITTGLDKIAPLLLTSFGPDKGTIFCGGKTVSLYSGLLTLIKHDDPFENIAIKLVEDMAADVYAKAGSGVSLAAVLTVGLVRASRQLIVAGYHPRRVHDWLETIGADFATHLQGEVDAVKSWGLPGQEEQIMKAVAITAAKDEKVGALIGDMCYQIGQFAHIDIVQDDIPQVRVEYRNGFTFKTAPLSYHFLKGKRKEFASPKIIFTDGAFDDVSSMVKILMAANKAEVPLIVMANSLSQDVMSLLTHNHNIGALDIIAIKAPSFSFGQFQALEDLAMITGGIPVSYAMSSKPTVEHLGTAPRVVVGQDYCTIYSTNPVPEEYIKRIKRQTAKVRSDVLKMAVNERVSNLLGKAAVLRVGGYTERERQEGYQKVETAVHAVRGAQSEGYIPGGYQVFRKFPFRANPDIPTPLYTGMQFPYTALMANYTGDVPSLNRITNNPVELFNVRTGKIENMLDAGVIDSVKSIRVAVESAISTAKILAITGAIVTEA
jgi:chaperonin GroEL